MKPKEPQTVTEWIDYYIKLFPKGYKEDIDFMERIVKWDDEHKAGFLMAKQLFDSKDEDCKRYEYRG